MCRLSLIILTTANIFRFLNLNKQPNNNNNKQGNKSFKLKINIKLISKKLSIK